MKKALSEIKKLKSREELEIILEEKALAEHDRRVAKILGTEAEKYSDIGDVFTVKDLFKGYKWNRMDKNTRLTLGRDFFREDLNPMLENGIIVALKKNSSGQQLYGKVK
jgi:hypothetical protein